MIKALIFDLDGTLVQTERLKAISYARAAVDLCPYSITQETVVEAFKEVVGRSRRVVAETLVARFQLGEAASEKMASLGVSTPWQAYIQLRLQYYNQMIADPAVLQENQWPFTVELLKTARAWGCATALATMSHGQQVNYILETLGISGAFDFIATRDDVAEGKPNPEIYSLVSSSLSITPDACLVFEDSPSGVTAALAARMHCIAVATPFTGKVLHESGLLEARWIVDEPEQLLGVVNGMMTEQSEAPIWTKDS